MKRNADAFETPTLLDDEVHRRDMTVPGHEDIYKQEPWAPARGEQGGQAPTLEKIRVGMAHPGNLSRGLTTNLQQ